MAELPYYIFDPGQFKEFGYRFFEGDGFYYRYQLSKRFFWKNIYIPLGPVCQTEKGFDNFLEHIKKTRLAKVTIDLPMIYSKKLAEEVIKKLTKVGYKKADYFFQDEETLLLFKDKFKLDSQKMNSVNRGYKSVNIIIKDKLTSQEIEEIYNIYLGSGQRIGFVPKTKEVFLKLSENCLVALAYGKEINELEGYAFGFFAECGKTDFSNKDINKILSNMFTGTTDKGREHKIGHAVHYDLFKTAFEKYGVDIVDLRGASRTKNRSYIHFKHDFSDEFYNLPGSFKKNYL